MRILSIIIFCLSISTIAFAKNMDKDDKVKCKSFTTKTDSSCFCNASTSEIVEVNNAKRCLPKCRHNTERHGNICRQKCSGNQLRINGVCNTCTGNREWIGEKCTQKCNKHQERNEETGKCLINCPGNMEKVGNSCMALCPQNYERVNNVCQLNCPSGSFREGNRCKKDLACNSDFEVVDNKCVRRCAHNLRRHKNGRCIKKITCNAGQEKVNGKCVQGCFTGQERVKGKCLMKCQTNFKRNEQNQCVYCVN